MKHLKIILLLFLFGIIFYYPNIHAKTYAGRFYEQGYQYSKVGVFAKEKGGSLDYNGWFIISTKDKNTYYCIEPNTTLNGSKEKSHTIYSGKSNMVKNSKLTNSKYEKINLLAYYGYGYKDAKVNHKAKKWYGITQVMIWRTMRTDLSWTFKTSRYGDTKSSLYKNEVKEMNNLVNNHKTKSSFSGTNQKLSQGQTVSLTDNNKVLENYTVTSSSNVVSVSKSGNILKIKGEKNGKATITFTKTSKINTDYRLFTSKTYQDLIERGKIDTISFQMTAEVVSNSINLQKEDSETGTKPGKNLSFEDATYEVLDSSNKKVGEITTDKDGKGILSVANGTYTLKEIKAPKGYEVNSEEYKVTVNNEDEKVTVKDKIIKGKVKIIKEKGSKEDGYKKEKDAQFTIFDENNSEVTNIVTDKNGKAEVELPYGKYEIRQTEGEKGYAFVEDFKIDINKSDEYTYELKNEKMSKLIFTKTDFSTSKPVPNTLIEIYNSNDTQIFKGRTDKNGKIEIERLEIGKYYILEKDAPKYYLLNNEKMPFEVKENGEVIKCNMDNHRKMGSLEIIKKDEMEDTTLKGAKIEVVFEETNKKVYTGTTNEEGKIYIDNLIAGKYCIHETKAPKGYKLDKKPKCIEIDKDGQKYQVKIKNKKNLSVPDTFLEQNKNKLLILSFISVLGVLFIIYETSKAKKKI